MRPTPTSCLLSILIALLTTLAQPAAGQSFLDEDTGELLIEAVEAAVELDLYYARCRRDLSGRRTQNLNKELVSKFRMTVIKVQDDLFPDGSYRRAQERLQEEFLARLREAGGCREAKEAGMPEKLSARYADLLDQIESLP